MPSVSRSRSLPVAPELAWRMLSDPHNLPRWWPRTIRVESVDGQPGARRSRFTQVLETRNGKPVRADYRCTEATRNERLVWEQQIEGTPFEKFLRAAAVEIRVTPADNGSTVTLEGRQSLRGLSRFGGGPMVRRATGRSLDEALANVEQALGGRGGG